MIREKSDTAVYVRARVNGCSTVTWVGCTSPQIFISLLVGKMNALDLE